LGRDKNTTIALQDINSRLTAAETQLTAATLAAIGAVRDPHALSSNIGDGLLALKSNLDVLKLPS
jgi:hypothetical protein